MQQNSQEIAVCKQYTKCGDKYSKLTVFIVSVCVKKMPCLNGDRKVI